MVLLKNDGLLPLKKEKLTSIAVIGPNANSRDALVGNYVGTSSQYITPLEGIQQYVGDDVRVYYSEGCHLYHDKVEALAHVKDRFAEAVIAAEQADVAGRRNETLLREFDEIVRELLYLSEDKDTLIRRIEELAGGGEER